MKFIIETITKEGCRHGVIRELGCHRNIAIETPGCLQYTRAAAVPHMTWDLVEQMNYRPQCMQLSCATLVDHLEPLSRYGKGIAQFASIPEGDLSYVSVQDTAHPSPTGYNDKNSVSVFTPAGRTKIDVSLFMSLQEAIQPDWFQALCDGDTPTGCSPKRIKKSVDRTLAMLDQCLQMKQKSQKLQGAAMLGVIEGGEELTERQRSARETALKPVDGFVLDAFTDQHIENGANWELIETVLKELPEGKPRLLSGVGRPDHVIRAVEAGLDMFDSAYPYEVTQRGCALVFPLETSHTSQDSSEERTSGDLTVPLVESQVPSVEQASCIKDHSSIEDHASVDLTMPCVKDNNSSVEQTSGIKDHGSNVAQTSSELAPPCIENQDSAAVQPSKDPENIDFSNSSSNNVKGKAEKGQMDPRFELDLSEKRFSEDFSPVVPGCECYCCTHHTRAYLNHLLNVNELLARVLLMNHNCQHYFHFFHAIRTALGAGTFQQLKDAVTGAQR